MSLVEIMIEVPVEHEQNVCGQLDKHVKQIEHTLNVTIVARNGQIKLIGEKQNVEKAKSVFMNLIALSKRDNVITEQNVNYALALSMEDKEGAIVEIDGDVICHTIQGKPIKPKTIGQKNYIDQIRKKMIVFGVGPAGTGKTYLAMAMAITAFKNDEVGKIIMTRPAIEAGDQVMVEQNPFPGIIIHDKFNIIQHKKFLSEKATVQEGKKRKRVSANKDTK